MNSLLRQVRYVAAISALFVSASAFANEPFLSAIGDSQHWAGTKWSKEDIARFGGMPVVLNPDVKSIILRYTYYVSDYDLEHRVPLWVAHVDGKESEVKAKSRKGKGTRWDR